MQKFKVLILTDHTGHSKENSLYALAQAMRSHPRCGKIDIATRGNEINNFFFKHYLAKRLFVSAVDENFSYSTIGKSYEKQIRRASVHEYDVVWLRMPPPLPKAFLIFLKHQYPNVLFINDPDGIYETGSKEFLMKFPELCAPMKVCRSVGDILEFQHQFPIVLKPFREYGGKGIVRIENGKVWEGKNELSLAHFLDKIKNQPIEYLGVKFLKNVSKGDKRIIVVNGKIVGASLRLPPEDSWLCNVALGGVSNSAVADEDEMEIVERINPILSKLGIVMYGVDTLVGDDGKRVLSEINTTSIGGVPQMAKQQGKPLVKTTTDLIWDFVIQKNNEKNAISN